MNKVVEWFEGDELAAHVWKDKYALKGEETPDDTINRITDEFFRIEQKYDNSLTREQIYDLFKGFKKVIPAGSPLFGIGNKNVTTSLSSCYVIDSPIDSYGGILKTDEELVQLYKRRGGAGFDISTLRPSGSIVNNAAKTSTGAISFMERYSNTTKEVAQQGRRGALMININISHPDILKFITAKDDLTKITGANISVKINDEFMKAVENDTEIQLSHPRLETPVIIKAKTIWDKLVHQAWKSAEPGVLFWDRIIQESPADCYKHFQTISTNPCCTSKNHDHFVLTNNGYKEIKLITNKDLIWIPDKNKWSETSGYFDSGNAEIFKVKLSNGTELFITNNHKLAKIIPRREGSKIIYEDFELTKLSDLSIGDPIKKYKGDIEITSNIGTYEEGIILGWLTGDGCLSYRNADDTVPTTYLTYWDKEHDLAYKTEKIINEILNVPISIQSYTEKYGNTKLILASSLITKYFEDKYNWNLWKFKSGFNPYLYSLSKEFIRGYLQSYYSADGSIYITKSKNSAIELTSINKSILLQIKNLLTIFDINSGFSISKKEGISKIRGKEYKAQNLFKLSITGHENIVNFINNIGFLNKIKIDKSLEVLDFLDKYVRSPKFKTYCKITEIESIGIQPVGCINIPEYHYFPMEDIISGNSELPLSAYDSCRLMHVNVYEFVENPFTRKASFNYEAYQNTVYKAQRLMDDMIDLEEEKLNQIIEKIYHDPESPAIKFRELQLWLKIRTSLLHGRRTGLNPLLGLADALAALNIKYDSDEAIAVAEMMAATAAIESYRSSIDMAQERGYFKDWEYKQERENPFLDRVLDALFNKYPTYEDIYKIYGRRNISNLTIPPSGSVAILAQVSSGIEPVFNLSYTRKRKVTEENERKTFKDGEGQWWEEYTVYHPKFQTWKSMHPSEYIGKSPYDGATTNEIDPLQKVKLQGQIQLWIDHSISVTTNLPETTTEQQVANIYMAAWKAGCKGATVYKEGSREGVLTNKKKVSFEQHDAPKRPKVVLHDVYNITSKGQKWTICVGLLDNKPYEVFATTKLNLNGKYSGEIIKHSRGKYDLYIKDIGLFEDITKDCSDEENLLTRMISTSLRHGADIKFVTDQLDKSEGDITSFGKGIARVLRKYSNINVSKEICPECSHTLTYEGGCSVCQNCGYSKCS